MATSPGQDLPFSTVKRLAVPSPVSDSLKSFQYRVLIKVLFDADQLEPNVIRLAHSASDEPRLAFDANKAFYARLRLTAQPEPIKSV
jgi:hypothetical protein